MKQTIGFSEFQDAFKSLRPDNFSLQGLGLSEYNVNVLPSKSLCVAKSKTIEAAGEAIFLAWLAEYE
jgi:hypothetical protein